MTSDQVVVERDGGFGPWTRHHGVRVEVGSFGPWETNAILSGTVARRDALVVDPGMGAAQPLMDRATANGLSLLHLIANSHGHIDHIFYYASAQQGIGRPAGDHIPMTRIGSTDATTMGSR